MLRRRRGKPPLSPLVALRQDSGLRAAPPPPMAASSPAVDSVSTSAKTPLPASAAATKSLNSKNHISLCRTGEPLSRGGCRCGCRGQGASHDALNAGFDRVAASKRSRTDPMSRGALGHDPVETG
jgi:hypothetical protein